MNGQSLNWQSLKPGIVAGVLCALCFSAEVSAQRSVESLSELMEKQARQQVDHEIAAAVAREEEARERATTSRRTRRKSSNVQIRRGDTSGVEQSQIGEGNLQSIRAGD